MYNISKSYIRVLDIYSSSNCRKMTILNHILEIIWAIVKNELKDGRGSYLNLKEILLYTNQKITEFLDRKTNLNKKLKTRIINLVVQYIEAQDQAGNYLEQREFNRELGEMLIEFLR